LQRTIHDELPPPLNAEDQITATDQVINHYETTTGTVHNFKYIGGVLANPGHKKAPGSWKVHYIKDGTEKVCGDEK